MGGEWCWDGAVTAMHAGAEPVALGGGLLVGGAFLAGMGAWAWRRRAFVAAAFFTRLTREDVRGHPARARLLDEVRRAPAVSTAALARSLGMNEGTALYHLRVLERAGLAKSLVAGRERRWTEAGARPGTSLPAARRRVLDAVDAAPGSTLTEVARGVGLAKSTTHHHVAALARDGLVEPRRAGRALRLYPGERDG